MTVPFNNHQADLCFSKSQMQNIEKMDNETKATKAKHQNFLILVALN
jgi:hypothetical protein